MIYTHEHFSREKNFEFDACIVGSGAGGSACAATLAKQGLKVVLLEAGPFLRPKDFSQREEEMFAKLFYESGGRRSQDKTVRVLHGQGVGGSTLHNINLCKRLPPEILTEWNLPALDVNLLDKCFEQVAKDLEISRLEESQLNRNNQLFKKGVEALGLAGGMLEHNRKGCLESGFCELGCSFNAKMNALRVYIPQLIKAQGQVFADTKALRFLHKDGEVSALEATVTDPKSKKVKATLNIKAKYFISAAGAIETPLLLFRSDISANGNVGARLHLHPGAVVCGRFEEPVRLWEGIPQSYECTELLSFKKEEHEHKRVWLIAGSAHPIGVAGMLPAFGDEHKELMKLYPYLSVVTPMLHDSTVGSVKTSDGERPIISYNLNAADRVQMRIGLKKAGEILFAAEASEVLIPFRSLKRYQNLKELSADSMPLPDFALDLVAVHPMSSVWMGEDPKKSCTDTSGKIHAMKNLYVADTSLYPTSLGIPPQVTTYAFGHYVGQQLVKA